MPALTQAIELTPTQIAALNTQIQKEYENAGVPRHLTGHDFLPYDSAAIAALTSPDVHKAWADAAVVVQKRFEAKERAIGRFAEQYKIPTDAVWQSLRSTQGM